MQLTKIAGVVLALLMVTGTAAAMPGAPVAQADDTPANDSADAADGGPAANVSDAADGDSGSNGSAAADRGAAGNEQTDRGPPADLPSQVPDFVAEIHQLVQQHLEGDLSGPLGEQISDLTPGEDDANESEDDDEETGDDDAKADDDADVSENDDAKADDDTAPSTPAQTDA